MYIDTTRLGQLKQRAKRLGLTLVADRTDPQLLLLSRDGSPYPASSRSLDRVEAMLDEHSERIARGIYA